MILAKAQKLGFVSLFTTLAAIAARADPPPLPDCSAAVRVAISKTFPRSTTGGCKSERNNGHDQFEVKVVKADGSKSEVDVSPDGKILQIEETIALDRVPPAVMTAFAAKYPHAKVMSAEKQTPASGAATYELAFSAECGRREATFTATGEFVEEE